ncbi:hypothetical protein ACWEQ8_17960 [Streptomyces noursei]
MVRISGSAHQHRHTQRRPPLHRRPRPTPLYYVFGDLKVLTPSEVHHYATHARPHRSGAWVLAATRRAHPFEEVFGSPPALAA